MEIGWSKCVKSERGITWNQGVKEYFTYNKNTTKDAGVGHGLSRNCLVNGAIAEKIAGRIEVEEKREIIHRQLLYGLKERRIYWKLNKKTSDRILWRTGFGRGNRNIA
jgi:hypothetical protein